MRQLFFGSLFLLGMLTIFLMWYFQFMNFDLGKFILYILAGLLLLGIYDVIQKKHTILRNFPLVGHFRYLLESISPEIQQYFIENNTSGRPFSRNLRSLAYRRAKNVNDTHPFGTQRDINGVDYMALRHSIYAVAPDDIDPRIIIGGDACRHPYSASILNISAMSFG